MRTQKLGKCLEEVWFSCQVIKFNSGQRHWLVVFCWLVCPTLNCISTTQSLSFITRFGIRTKFHGEFWLRNMKIYDMGDQLYNRRNIEILNVLFFLVIEAFLFCHVKQESVTISFFTTTQLRHQMTYSSFFCLSNFLCYLYVLQHI